MQRKAPFILPLIAVGAMTSGCSESLLPEDDKGRKVEVSGSSWYDYGNGLINLNNVSFIKSEISVRIIVGTREAIDLGDKFMEYFQKLSEEEQIKLAARSDFCFDSLRGENENDRYERASWEAVSYSGSIPDLVSGETGRKLDAEVQKVGNYAKAEFAKACAVSVNVTSAIQFDNFTVSLEEKSFDVIMPRESFEDGAQLSDEKASAFFSEQLASQISDSKGHYGEIYSRILK